MSVISGVHHQDNLEPETLYNIFSKEKLSKLMKKLNEALYDCEHGMHNYGELLY